MIDFMGLFSFSDSRAAAGILITGLSKCLSVIEMKS